MVALNSELSQRKSQMDQQMAESVSTAAVTEVEGMPSISPEDEAIVRDNPKIAFICQFLGIFRNVMKIQVSKNFITEEIIEMQEQA